MRFFAFIAIIGFALYVRSTDGQSNYSESEELRAIGQFLNYVDSISRIRYNNVFSIFSDYFKDMVNSVPQTDRGATYALIANYLVELEEAKESQDLRKMRQVASEFEPLGNKVRDSLEKQQAEDIIIMPKLFGMLFLLPRIQAIKENFVTKFTRGVDVLSSRFSDEGFARHEQLFELLTEMKNSPSQNRMEELEEELERQKHRYSYSK